MKTCVDFIMTNNCPDPLICGINCASTDSIVKNNMKIVPFNNHGVYYLRIRTCLFKVHSVSDDDYDSDEYDDYDDAVVGDISLRNVIDTATITLLLLLKYRIC